MYQKNKTLALLFTCLFLLSFPFVSHAKDTISKNNSDVIHQKDGSMITWVKTWWYKNKPGRDNELKELKMKLRMNQELLAKVEASMENIVNNAPFCPNGQMSVSFENDPTDELREEIAELKRNIARLE